MRAIVLALSSLLLASCIQADGKRMPYRPSPTEASRQFIHIGQSVKLENPTKTQGYIQIKNLDSGQSMRQQLNFANDGSAEVVFTRQMLPGLQLEPRSFAHFSVDFVDPESTQSAVELYVIPDDVLPPVSPIDGVLNLPTSDSGSPSEWSVMEKTFLESTMRGWAGRDTTYERHLVRQEVPSAPDVALFPAGTGREVFRYVISGIFPERVILESQSSENELSIYTPRLLEAFVERGASLTVLAVVAVP